MPNDSKNFERTIESKESKITLYKKELIFAIAKIPGYKKKPISTIRHNLNTILLPYHITIPYYTVYHVIIGKSNHPLILTFLSDIGVIHNRMPDRLLKEHSIVNLYIAIKENRRELN
ncbi:hypothetical protein CH375_22495 [Leptospira ellisii]|nr:hypothetical protein CH375_22495 [Leptospira ellisii]